MEDVGLLFKSLEKANAHVWSLFLDATPDLVEAYASLLSPDEWQRRACLLEGEVRDRFTIARGGLRIILGRYLDRPPGAIEFAYGARRKPRLADAELHFNLTHSGDLAVYAFSCDRELGVDVERLTHIPEMMQIARRFFAPDEFKALQTLPSEQRVRSFYRAWTRKEAFIKAVGDGFHTPLDSFSVNVDVDEPARIITLNGSARAALEWHIHHLNPAPGYLGALAYPGPVKALSLMNSFNPAALLIFRDHF